MSGSLISDGGSTRCFVARDLDLSDGIQVPIPTLRDLYVSTPLLRSSFSKQIIDSPRIARTEVTIIPTAGSMFGRIRGTSAAHAVPSTMTVPDGRRRTSSPSPFLRTTAAWEVDSSTHAQSLRGTRIPSKEHSSDATVLSLVQPVRTQRSAYVSRVPEGSVQDLTKYEYWSKPWWNPWGSGSWVKNNPSGASAVISAPVSEMSVAYNDYLKKYVALYCNGSNNVVMRTASAPQGPWSSAQTLVTATQIPGGLYAPFIHPWSTGKDLYFNLSLWSAYSVMLMHTVLP